MKRILWAAALCAGVDSMGCWLAISAEALEARLQGRWEIVSVHRDGQMDPTPFGGTLVFAGDTVKFEPTYLRWNAVAPVLEHDQAVSSIHTSTLWEPAKQGQPAPILDGTS